jgi:hypothetical protein
MYWCIFAPMAEVPEASVRGDPNRSKSSPESVVGTLTRLALAVAGR